MKILIAEDDFTSRTILIALLKKLGYDPIAVSDGKEAWEILNGHDAPNLAILDWNMPEMDGIELCKVIRGDSSRDYVFIILLTARNSRQDIIRGLEAGVDDYLIKPLDPAELTARIKNGMRILDLERCLKKANKKIKIASMTDSLTGIYNRGYLTDHLPNEINRARRYGHSLSLILCDIDYFKKVNDIFGHLTGDHVLKEFVQSLAESIRENVDWIARYGGEEFIIILPETNCESARIVAERLRNRIALKEMNMQGEKIRITASFGITGFNVDTLNEKISVEAMISKADEYLYQAKENGRDRIETGQL